MERVNARPFFNVSAIASALVRVVSSIVCRTDFSNVSRITTTPAMPALSDASVSTITARSVMRRCSRCGVCSLCGFRRLRSGQSAAASASRPKALGGSNRLKLASRYSISSPSRSPTMPAPAISPITDSAMVNATRRATAGAPRASSTATPAEMKARQALGDTRPGCGVCSVGGVGTCTKSSPSDMPKTDWDRISTG